MKNYLLKMLFLAAAVVGVFGVSTSGTNAQWRDNDRRDERRNSRYSRNQVDRLITNLENRVDRFVQQFDRSLDNSRLDNTRREVNLNQRARQLENATDELRREFNRYTRNNDWYETRQNVSNCLRIAGEIDRVMERRRLGNGAERNWANVKTELNALARAYNLRGI